MNHRHTSPDHRQSLIANSGRHFQRAAWSAAMLGCLGLVGCSGGASEDDLYSELAQLEQPLMNGVAASADAQREFGVLTVQSANERCAGVLLNSQFALTAEHCIDSPQQLPRVTFLGQSVGVFAVQVPNTGEDIAVLALNSNFDRALLDELDATPAFFTGQLSDLRDASLTCFGTGATGIRAGGGLTGAGALNTRTATVSSTSSVGYTIANFAAPGDSGVPCFLDGGVLAGITSTTRFEAANGDVNRDGVTNVFDATRIISSFQVGVSPLEDFILDAMDDLERPPPSPTGPIFF